MLHRIGSPFHDYQKKKGITSGSRHRHGKVVLPSLANKDGTDGSKGSDGKNRSPMRTTSFGVIMEMIKEEEPQWEYTFVVLTAYSGKSTRKRATWEKRMMWVSKLKIWLIFLSVKQCMIPFPLVSQSVVDNHLSSCCCVCMNWHELQCGLTAKPGKR